MCNSPVLQSPTHSTTRGYLPGFIICWAIFLVPAAPQLFISLGTGQRAALLATIVTGVVNHFATYVSLWAADSFGRRLLFLEGGVQMLIALVRYHAAL